jgi:predicted Zn-ribbon and HTH transcriptional regulator
MLTVHLTHNEQLTEHEQNLAKRICSCTLCEHLWVRRIKRIPTRCPKCARSSWNRPLLESLRAIESNQADLQAKKEKAD